VLEFILFPIFVFACKSSNREVGCNYKARGVHTNVRGVEFRVKNRQEKGPMSGDTNIVGFAC
jgi:hypothetical protein